MVGWDGVVLSFRQGSTVGSSVADRVAARSEAAPLGESKPSPSSPALVYELLGARRGASSVAGCCSCGLMYDQWLWMSRHCPSTRA
jgi:hypothetical protein